jgi:predicted nucleic acid-binding protein
MEIVVDTSVIVAVLVGEAHRAALIKATRASELLAPPSVHWEVGNAFSAMFKRGGSRFAKPGWLFRHTARFRSVIQTSS